MIELATTTN